MAKSDYDQECNVSVENKATGVAKSTKQEEELQIPRTRPFYGSTSRQVDGQQETSENNNKKPAQEGFK